MMPKRVSDQLYYVREAQRIIRQSGLGPVDSYTASQDVIRRREQVMACLGELERRINQDIANAAARVEIRRLGDAVRKEKGDPKAPSKNQYTLG